MIHGGNMLVYGDVTKIHADLLGAKVYFKIQDVLRLWGLNMSRKYSHVKGMCSSFLAKKTGHAFPRCLS